MKSIKRRADSFFGIHNDFHAKPADGQVIGATLKESDLRTICETLQPDFIQIDCKGHPGWTSYPSALGNAMPEISQDLIAMWRKVTKEYGIALYLHYSGLYEIKYCQAHPEDRIINREGKALDFARADSNYVDNLLIPQISELVDRYDIDGIWVDGECWAVDMDYRPETVAKFEARTGIDLQGKPPKSDDDPYFREYMEFARELYREYLNHYVDVLHEKYPKLQICSNWAFLDHMPEKVCANVDFLSGDMYPGNCILLNRYSARMAARHGIAWDMMSWNYRFCAYGVPTHPAKHPMQIMQEAATVIALGGAYQDYIAQFPDGSANVKVLTDLAPLAKFMRQREPYCFKGRPIHQVAMLVSTYDKYMEMGKPFSPREGRDRLSGLVNLLCDSGLSTEIVCEHNLEGHWQDYPLLIVPELYTEPKAELIADLQSYAENGGSLLIIGARAARLLAPHFGFTVAPSSEFLVNPAFVNLDNGHNLTALESADPCYFSLDGNRFGSMIGAYTVNKEDAVTYGKIYGDTRDTGIPVAQVFSRGKGQVGVIGTDMGVQYYNGMQYLHRELVKKMADAMFTPLAHIDECIGMVEMVCLEKDGKFMLQLVNTNGQHTNNRVFTEDTIPPVVDLQVSILANKPVEKLILQPEGRNLPFTLEDGRYRFTVDRLDLHNIVEVQYKK